MANILEMLKGQMTDSLLDQLGQQIGGASREQTATAASGVFSTLMTALNKNASTPEGLNSLNSALERDHDGGMLEDLMGLIGGKAQNQKAANGEGILKHVLGGKQDMVSQMIAKMSGIDSNASMGLMTKLAPMVLGMLGKQKRQQGLDAGGLGSLIGASLKTPEAQQQELGLIGKLLDKDGDGNVMDDLLDMGSGLLSSMFKK